MAESKSPLKSQGVRQDHMPSLLYKILQTGQDYQKIGSRVSGGGVVVVGGVVCFGFGGWGGGCPPPRRPEWKHDFQLAFY